MKYIFLIVAFACLFSCGAIVDPTPSTIDKSAQFLHLELNVLPKDKNIILADLSILNTSNDSILLYKPLFPFNGKIIFPCFSIFSASTYDEVDFAKPIPKLDIYLDNGVNDAENSADKYFTLHSGELVRFQVNLADWYDLRDKKSGEAFKIAPSISIPFVDFHYRQKYEVDSVDGKMKPVYFHLTLPDKKDIDSMRVKFTMP